MGQKVEYIHKKVDTLHCTSTQLKIIIFIAKTAVSASSDVLKNFPHPSPVGTYFMYVRLVETPRGASSN